MLLGKKFGLKKLFTGILDYLYLCSGIQCKGRREARARLRRGGMSRDQRVSCSRLDSVRKGSGESGKKNATEVGVNWAVPSVPIRALTDQRLWARVGET